MNLGERIYQLRKKRNLSQGELAERLDVSRQSVSKWETNASVPDLDKLVRLSEVFEVTLDELIKGKGDAQDDDGTPEEAPPPDGGADHGTAAYAYSTAYAAYGASMPYAPPARPISGTQQGVGFVLLTVGLLAVVLFSVLGGFGTGLLIGVPLVLCGTICLKCRRRAGLWCGWTLFLLTAVVLRLMTSVSTSLIWYALRGQVEFSRSVVIAWLFVGAYVLLLAGTVWSYRGLVLPWCGKTWAGLVVSGAVFAVSELLPMLMAMAWAKILQGNVRYEDIAVPMMWYQLGLSVCELAGFISAAVLLVLLTACIRGSAQRRRNAGENS
ncbi:MAG: helix-turn-helix transcriptional regulator [Clostridia bacterium]|nr:helix-turn-helix transcriptional regulator [Clostridia bacterium]